MPVINLHGTPTFQGEALLLGWSENNRDGMTVRFAMDPTDEGSGHPFKGLGTGKFGQRFMLVAVPLSDDEKSAPAVSENRPETPTGSRTPGRSWDELSYAQQAGIACADPEFWGFCTEVHDNFTQDADKAAAFVRWHCDVKSRADLDKDEGAAERWRVLHGEFRRWKADRTGQDQAEAQARAYVR